MGGQKGMTAGEAVIAYVDMALGYVWFALPAI